MMSGKDGGGQIINACVTVVTRIALTGRFRIINATLDDLFGFTRGARDPARPASFTDGLITLNVIDEILDVDLHRWTPVRGRDMRGHLCILSSNATTLESNMSDIPKEKVLALAEVVEDVGADRGFLLSEIGFQSGAILQAARRNITLTSLQDLREAVKSDMNEQVLSRLSWKANRAKAEYWRRHYEGEKYLTEPIPSPHWFYLDYLSVVFDEATREQYPLVYKFDSALKLELVAHSVEELISGVDELVSAAEKDLAAEPWPPERNSALSSG